MIRWTQLWAGHVPEPAAESFPKSCRDICHCRACDVSTGIHRSEFLWTSENYRTDKSNHQSQGEITLCDELYTTPGLMEMIRIVHEWSQNHLSQIRIQIIHEWSQNHLSHIMIRIFHELFQNHLSHIMIRIIHDWFQNHLSHIMIWIIHEWFQNHSN